VPFDKRKAFFGLVIAGGTAAILFLPAIYLVGMALAPPPPVPATTHVTPLVADAIWARAGGGRATELIPVTPLTIAQFAACIAIEDFKDTTSGDARRVAACRGHLPAIQGLEYLSSVHMRDANLKPSFREGIGRFATTMWMTRSWTRAEFVDTLAERGEFGAGFRGVEAAAQGYFGRSAAQLPVSQAAMLAAFIANRRMDPWCDPATAADLRNRVLERMRDDAVLDQATYQSANASELGLTAPPADHKPCSD
jgi:penicillin-binding protein 1A